MDRVKRKTPAAVAGIRSDDMIVSIAGKKVGNLKEYNAVVDELRPGEEIIVIVKRGKEFLRIPIVPQVRK